MQTAKTTNWDNFSFPFKRDLIFLYVGLNWMQFKLLPVKILCKMRKKKNLQEKTRLALILANKRKKSYFYYFLGIILSRNRPGKMAQQVRLAACCHTWHPESNLQKPHRWKARTTPVIAPVSSSTKQGHAFILFKREDASSAGNYP